MDWIEFEIGRKEKYTVLIDKQDAWILDEYYILPHIKKETNRIRIRTRCRKKDDLPAVKAKRVDISNLVLKPKQGFVIDHKNGDGLDNRRINLRYATNGQNSQNSVQSGVYGGKKMTSRFKGVVWIKDEGKWRVIIRSDGEVYYLGRFINEASSARAYDKKALELHGSFANLNFKKKKLLKRV